MQVLIDTNVVVSAFIGSPTASASRCWDRVLSGRWQMVLSTATFLEVCEVLERFADGRGAHETLTELIGEVALWSDPRPSGIILRDPGDQKWLDLLHGSRAAALITYNLRDFAPARRAFRIVNPADALREL